jgi:hypothetical protein
MIYWQIYFATHQLWKAGCNSQRILFRTNEPGMFLKTKGDSGKAWNEAGMFVKTMAVSSLKRECR